MLAGMSAAHWIVPKKEVSYAERRLLQPFPPIPVSRLFDDAWTESFERYTLDHFVLRDRFRALKAFVVFDVFRQMDNNGVFVVNQNVFKLSGALDEASLRKAAGRIERIAGEYFAGSRVFYALIPDKSMYLDPDIGYPTIDHDFLERFMAGHIASAQPVPLSGSLELDSYYRTDIHWRQDRLLPVVEVLGRALGFVPYTTYEQTMLHPFYGGYYGQSALAIPPDNLTYLNNDAILRCRATDLITGKSVGIYDPENFFSVDPYNLFLGGPVAVIDVVNPDAPGDRELVIFRDSYASSLAPLLFPYYSRITLIDLRYVPLSKIPDYADASGQDVLFLYSDLLANSSFLLR